MSQFDINSLPDLDTVVLAALDLFAEEPVNFSLPDFQRPMIIGSAGSLGAGRMMFGKQDALFADESNVSQLLNNASGLDGAVLISASGGKHAVTAAKLLNERGLPTVLLTNNPEAPAAQFIDPDKVFVFPKNREPYTYNTSTYLGMVLSQTKESTAMIRSFIEDEIDPLLTRNFADYNAFVFIVPSRLSEVSSMIRIKFEEMFMPLVVGRAYSEEEIKHAKAVVPSEKELFISLGVVNDRYGYDNNRMFIPLDDTADYGAVMAAAYYLVGKIQAAHPPYFKDNVVALCERMSTVFGTEINPIVE